MEQESDNIALVDLDGTLADFDDAMTAQLQDMRSPGEPPEVPRAIGDDGPRYLRARRDAVMRQVGFWLNLKPIVAGMEVLDLIHNAGYTIDILTKASVRKNRHHAWSEKIQWVERHVPDRYQVGVTITQRKGGVYGRVLFDDWPPYVTPWLLRRPRGLVLMLEQPWNEGFEHPQVLRVPRRRDGSVMAPDVIVRALEKYKVTRE